MFKQLLFLLLITFPVFSQSTGLNFDGTNDYLDFGNVTPIGTRTTFTIETWVKIENLTNVQGQNPIYGEYTSVQSGGLSANYLLIQDNGKVAFDQFVPSGGIFESVTSLEINKWYHIAYVQDGTAQEQYLYINGKLDAYRENAIEAVVQRQYAYIGARGGSGATPRYFDGTLDEFRIWNTARSKAQICENMHVVVPSTSTDLALQLSFNEGNIASGNQSINTVVDGTNSYNNIVLQGFAKVGVFSNWMQGAPVNTEGIIYTSGLFNPSSRKVGSSWNHAFDDLQYALAVAGPCAKIWVAKGTYKPTASTDRNISFQIPDSVQVFGGFTGTESPNFDLTKRDFVINETILSGDIGTIGNNADNTFNVVYTEGVCEHTRIDGFTITAGNATETFGERVRRGAGMYNNGVANGSSNPTIAFCVFRSNTAIFGGGLYNNGDNFIMANPVLISCSFISNMATISGGAVFNDGYGGESSPVLSACRFTANTAGSLGGAVYNFGVLGKSSPVLSACSFTANTAGNNGGAIYWNSDSGNGSSLINNCLFTKNGKDHIAYDDGDANTQPHFINCTFYGATQYAINIRYFDPGQTPIDFTNCIFWNNNGDIVGTSNTFDPQYGANANVNIRNSIVEEAAFTQGAFSGNNNIFADPLFVDAANGIFNLQCNSPAIDEGDKGVNPPATDITGFTRINNPDLGAYEFGYAVVDQPITDGSNTNINDIPYVTAKSLIENTNNVTYKGSRSIELLPGFRVAPTSGQATVFKAEIGGGCN